MAGIYFKESQKTKPNQFWIIFLSLYLLMFWALLKQFSEKIDTLGISSIVFSLCLIIFFNILVIVMSLMVEIDEAKITYRYKPFHLKPRIIYWEDVKDFYIRDFRPLREYGGHGLKRHYKNGRSFTVSGKKGLQLILKNGKKILFGTQRPQELESIITKINSRRN